MKLTLQIFRLSIVLSSLFLATLIMNELVSAQDGEAVNGFLRCATIDDAPADIVRAPVDNKYGKQTINVIIPVAFHIIHQSDGMGNVPDSQIQDQINVLIAAYAVSGFSFKLASVDRTQNNWWFNMKKNSIISIIKEWQMKSQLAIDPTHTLNIYTCKPNDVLGWAVFPSDR